MFASTPATSRRNRRHPSSSRRLLKSSQQQKSTRKTLEFLTTDEHQRRTSFEQSLVTKRPRRTRDRTIIYDTSRSFAVSTSSLLPRALRPEEKNNASTSSSIVREDGWCIVLRQASLFVFTINRDESPMDSPLKSPKYSFQLDFPASVSSIPSKNRFPACLFFGSDDSLPGVVAVSTKGYVRCWSNISKAPESECRALQTVASDETCESIVCVNPTLFLVSTSKGRIVRIVRDANLGQIKTQAFHISNASSSSSFLGLSSLFGGGSSSSSTSTTSSPIRKLLVANKDLIVLRETFLLECYDIFTSNLKWKMDSVQCVSFSKSSSLLYVLDTNGVLNSVTTNHHQTTKRLTRILDDDEKQNKKTLSLHITSDAIFVVSEEESEKMLVRIFDLKSHDLISLPHLIRGGLGSGPCRDSLCILDDEDDVVLCVERKRRVGGDGNKDEKQQDEEFEEKEKTQNTTTTTTTRTNIIRESDEILGDRHNNERTRTSSSIGGARGADPIFKDFRKERLGHYPELVRHRIQSKRQQHERLRVRLRDQGVIHNLTKREMQHLERNEKYIADADIVAEALETYRGHRDTLIRAMRRCVRSETAIVQDEFFSRLTLMSELPQALVEEIFPPVGRKLGNVDTVKSLQFVNALFCRLKARPSYETLRDLASRVRAFVRSIIISKTEMMDDELTIRLQVTSLLSLCDTVELLNPRKEDLEECLGILRRYAKMNDHLFVRVQSLAVDLCHAKSMAELLENDAAELRRHLYDNKNNNNNTKDLARALFDHFYKQRRLRDLFALFDRTIWAQIWDHVRAFDSDIAAWIVGLELFEHQQGIVRDARERVERRAKREDRNLDLRTKRVMLSIARLMEIVDVSSSSSSLSKSNLQDVRVQETVLSGKDNSESLSPVHLMKQMLGKRDVKSTLEALKVWRRNVRSEDVRRNGGRIPKLLLDLRSSIWASLFLENMSLWRDALEERSRGRISEKELARLVRESGLYHGLLVCPDGPGALNANDLKDLCDRAGVDTDIPRLAATVAFEDYEKGMRRY